ncbi:MAG: hypothetical protein HOC23_21180 [Halieaceae bacterium]|nr:hypothetical protein [Halieaceae bacterium]
MLFNYRLRDLPRMLLTPGGRIQIRGGIKYRIYPLIFPLAWIYRRTVGRGTRTIVVVGSFGKSTTTRTVSAALGIAPHPDMVRNYSSYVALALLRVRLSQPWAVIEVGIGGPGQMAGYARLTRPDVVVVTSIGSEGTTRLGALENIRTEKLPMLRALPASGIALVNGDDPHVMWMAGQTTARVITYGFGPQCDIRASDLRLEWPQGSYFKVDALGVKREVRVRLIGRHMMYPALAAIAVSRLEELDLDLVLPRLALLPPTPGRMEPIALSDGVTVLRDDFKATLETMYAALDLFVEVPARRRIVVFGDVNEPPPDRSVVYEGLGAQVAKAADQFIVVGSGYAEYSKGARRAGMPETAVYDGGTTPSTAVATLRSILKPGDAVLIKGRRGQMLDRIRLALQGECVRCDLSLCDLSTECSDCPVLAEGWGGKPYFLQHNVTAQ